LWFWGLGNKKSLCYKGTTNWGFKLKKNACKAKEPPEGRRKRPKEETMEETRWCQEKDGKTNTARGRWASVKILK